MPGAGLASLAAGLGHKASRGIGAAKGSIFGVAQEAVRGQQAAEAQVRNHKHARNIIGLVHKNAAEGTELRTRVRSGEHDIDVGYIKGSSNPTRDAAGYRHDQPDHVGNAKALAAPKEDIVDAEIVHDEPAAAGAIKNRPQPALEAPKASAETEPQDSTRRFVTDSKGGTRSVDRRDSSFESHLNDNEASYLAERAAKIRQHGVGIKPTTGK